MSDEMSPEARRVYEQVAASVREALKGFVDLPCNRAQVAAAVERVLLEQREQFASDVPTCALVAPARAEGRATVWGLPCLGSPEVPDNRVVLVRYGCCTGLEEAAAEAEPSTVTLRVTFDVLRAWRVTWPEASEPMVVDAIPVREEG